MNRKKGYQDFISDPKLEPVKCEKCPIICCFRFKGTNRLKQGYMLEGTTQCGETGSGKMATFCKTHSHDLK